MAKNPNVDDAYAMSSPEEVKALYRTWSHSYDVVFSDSQGYQLPRKVASYDWIWCFGGLKVGGVSG